MSLSMIQMQRLAAATSARRMFHTTKAMAASSTPTFSLSGRTSLVTGSTSGIGLGVARVLASHGANVVLNGFGDAKEIAALQKELETEFSVKVAYSGADMSKPEQVQKMVTDAIKEFGSLDILVNNAGIQHVSPVESFPANKWEQVIGINLSGPFYAIQAALPSMQAKGWGRIINIASAHGKVGSANKSAYVASKHGIVGLSKVVALENANKGITCNAICPGWVLTPLVQKQIDARAAAKGTTVQQEKESLLGEKQPMLEFSSPESLGHLTAFLCSPAGKTMTGTELSMDGGWVAQ